MSLPWHVLRTSIPTSALTLSLLLAIGVPAALAQPAEEGASEPTPEEPKERATKPGGTEEEPKERATKPGGTEEEAPEEPKERATKPGGTDEPPPPPPPPAEGDEVPPPPPPPAEGGDVPPPPPPSGPGEDDVDDSAAPGEGGPGGSEGGPGEGGPGEGGPGEGGPDGQHVGPGGVDDGKGGDLMSDGEGPGGPASDDAAFEEERTFVEGELASIGSIGLVPWQNRFGLTLGVERLGEIFYGALTPEINWTKSFGPQKDLTMSFGVPIRVEVLDNRADIRFSNVGTFRKEDWNEFSDAAKIIRYLTFGGKESRTYLDINQFKAWSIGHGVHMKRFNPNLDLNVNKVSAEFDAFMDYGGGEVFIDDITGPQVMGALAFLKPLSLINRDNYMMRSFSVGVEVFADTEAPLRNTIDEEDVDNDGRRRELKVNQKSFQPDSVNSQVLGYGLSVELKLIDTDILDWKTYGGYSRLESGVPIDDPDEPLFEDIPTRAVAPDGMFWGNLFRINTESKKHAFRIRTELRSYAPNYLPSYFDTLYAVQRYQYPNISGNARPENLTKIQQVLGRDEQGDQVKGAYFEWSWLYEHYLALALGLEINDQTADNSLFTTLEVPHIGRWQFLATYQRRNQEKIADIFAFDFGSRDLFIAKMRYGLFRWLHFNFEAITPFGVGPESIYDSTVQLNFSADFGFAY